MEELMQMAKQFVGHSRRKTELEAELSDVKKKMGELEPVLLTAIEEEKFPESSRVDGMTVFLRRQVWASAKDGDYEAACEALRAAGLEEYVNTRFNVQSVSAYVRDLEREEIPLDPRLVAALNITEKFSVQARAS